MRNGLEGEASIGHEPRLLSSKEEAHSNCVSNITHSRKGDLGGPGLTQLKFNISRIYTSSCCLGEGLRVITCGRSRPRRDVPQWFVSLQAV